MRRCLHILALGFLLLVTSDNALHAANGKAKITFVGIDGKLLRNVEKHVRLVKRLRTKGGPELLDGERRRLEERVPIEVKQALEPFGYYKVDVTSEVSSAPDKYKYIVELKEPVRVNRVEIDLNESAQSQEMFKKWRNEYPLRQGDPLDQSLYSDANKSLIASAVSKGYFDAVLSRRQIVINEDRTSADIFLIFDSGQRYKISRVEKRWKDEDNEPKRRVRDSILDPLITVQEDDYFSAQALSETQRQLLTTPYFAAVDVRSGDRDKASGEVPLEITFTPNKRKAYSVTAGVGTDTGVRGSIGYENRRINSKGHNLNVRIGGSEIQRTAILNYRIPLAGSSDDSLNYFGSLEEEFGDSRRFKSVRVGTELVRKWDEALLKFSLTASREEFTRFVPDPSGALNEVDQSTDLLMPGISWERNKADDLYFPTKGWSASVALRAASESLASDIDLAQAIVTAKYLRPLGPGRIKLRLKAASSIVDEATDIPESLGFLAGGDDSIRGYKFESIGVERDGRTAIGKNLTVGSFEYQHPVYNGISLAGFFDIGDAFDSSPDYKKGVGLGLRWRLPFGALRLDAASALDLEGDPIRLHFSFGTDL